jgi:hypothetical protein
MGLEDERLARRQDAELTAAARLPEIHLAHLWPGSQEAIPAVIGHAHIRPHNRYCALPPFQRVIPCRRWQDPLMTGADSAWRLYRARIARISRWAHG